MELLTEWLKDIFIVIVSISFIEILIPNSSMAKYLKFIFSIIILEALLEPVRILCNI